MTQDQALTILKTGANVFLTGEPGAGKTHTVNQYTAYLRDLGIEPAITASTGIAATHIGGMTIHSWSGIGIKNFLDKYDLERISSTEYVVKRILRAHVLIIDEVSMLAANTLSMVDAVCREVKQNQLPFGGMQVILVGDFFQLPPIVRTQKDEQQDLLEDLQSPFAYNSPAWTKANPIACYLTEQHRQDDQDYLKVLSAIRQNIFGDADLKHIESRKIKNILELDSITKLYTHNMNVDQMNDQMLGRLKEEPKVFTMQSHGLGAIVDALKKGCLSPESLQLKVGAVVMFTKNNPKEGFVNGTLGEVERFNKDNGYPIVKTKSGERIEVEPAEWTVEENGKVRARITQLPLRLAWAITVHKSQGMSLDEAVMDLSKVFEFGQGYVALSRVRRLSGLHLLGWNARTFHVHPEVLEKDESFRQASVEANEAFDKISGDELKQMQENFIAACGGRKEKQAEKVDTYHATLVLWNEGRNLSEIAEHRKLKEGTILEHIETLLEGKKITREALTRLLTPVIARDIKKIHEVFKKLDSPSLGPVYKSFDGAYSYNELKIARMLIV